MGYLELVFWIFFIGTIFICPLCASVLALFIISKIEKTSFKEVLEEYLD